MRKILMIISVLSLICTCAFAQNTGNLGGTAFVETWEEGIFLAEPEGIYRIDDTESKLIFKGTASRLQYSNGRLYFLSETWTPEDEYGYKKKLSETPMSCLPNGNDLLTLGEPRPCGEIYEFDADARRVDTRIGYRSFTVTEDNIYFLGNAGLPYEYTCILHMEDETVSTIGHSEDAFALFRMDKNGENLTRLTAPLGNSVACMSIDNGKICIAAGWQDMNYAYNFVNYTVLDMEGNLLTVSAKPDENRPFSSDSGEYYHITQSVLARENGMLISLQESEGDFTSSHLEYLNNDGTMKCVAYEYAFVPACVIDSTVFYIGTENQSLYDDDFVKNPGVYRKNLNEDGIGMRLATLNEGDRSRSFDICVCEPYVYYRGGDGKTCRILFSGGTAARFDGNAFRIVK